MGADERHPKAIDPNVVQVVDAMAALVLDPSCDQRSGADNSQAVATALLAYLGTPQLPEILGRLVLLAFFLAESEGRPDAARWLVLGLERLRPNLVAAGIDVPGLAHSVDAIRRSQALLGNTPGAQVPSDGRGGEVPDGAVGLLELLARNTRK